MNRSNFKILVVEDHENTAKYFAKILVNAGFSTDYTTSGPDALQVLRKTNYHLVVTDWLMPMMDGIELIRNIHDKISPSPIVIMITSKQSEKSKETALFSGADEFITKPVKPDDLINRIEVLIDREYKEGLTEEEISVEARTLADKPLKLPPHVGVAIASSTGGPPTLIEVLSELNDSFRAAIYVVQHGPSWMLQSFADRIAETTGHRTVIGGDNMPTTPGTIYLAPGEIHMVVNPETYNTELFTGPKENFIIPAADPLFRSVARAFGKYSIGVVLTGLGRDGTLGAAVISAAGGKILVQDPASAVAPSMPRSVIKANIQCHVLPVKDLGAVLSTSIFQMAALLKKNA